MTYLESQVAGLAEYWWKGHTAAYAQQRYDVDGLTAEQMAACEAGYIAAESEIVEHQEAGE